MRALTGAVFVIVLVGCIVWNDYSLIGLFLLIVILGLWEFYRLAGVAGANPQRVWGTVAGSILFLCIACSSMFTPYWLPPALAISLPLPFLFASFIIELYRKSEKPFANIAYTLAGIIYIALPFALLVKLPDPTTCKMGYGGHTSSFQPGIILGFFILMWTSDTGAYISGKLLGKTKLFERVSPKKTWEGTIGGAILCFAAAYVLWIYNKDLFLVDWLMVALIIVIAGSLGDLVESMFKRSINIKDSGSILPGHGGILDRFDAAIIAAPFVFTYLVMAKHWF